MGSWCFDSLDMGYVPNETLVRNKGVRDFKITSNYENSNLSRSQQSVENHGFSELGSSEVVKTQIPNDSVKNVFYNESSVGVIYSASMVTSGPVFGEEELNSSSRESSLIEVKLGGVSDGLNCNSSRSAPFSSESSTQVKRVKGTRFSCQTVCCQVHGCNKDLSSAKDYHKRHKVCDAHSKTSEVIVNGVEQRFCQQCSRFHLVAEFDEGRRSCRKRLAGHNERRRKPQVGYINGRARRSLLYTGSVVRKFQRTPPEAAFFSCPDTLHIDASHTDNIRTNGWGAHVKTEDETNHDTKSFDIFVNGQLQENTVLSPFLSAKQYCSIDNIRDNNLGENVTQIPHEIVLHSLVQMNSLGSQDLTTYDTASTVHGVPGISEAGCALSLLSAQAQNSSDLPSGTSRDHTSVIPNTSPHYSVSEVSQKLIGVGSQGLTSGNQKCFSLGRNNDSIMSSVSNGDFANSSFEGRILQGSDFVNVNNSLSCEEGTTVNLLQLSSQFHRVENQRQTAIGKHETEFLVSWNDDIRDQN